MNTDADASEVTVEATGETVGEAKWKALRDLERAAPGLDKEAVRFQVVSEGERGLLGVGYTPARVLASTDAVLRPPRERSADESDVAQHARELVETVIGAMGVVARVEMHEDDDGILATCIGSDLGVVIGKHGQTIDALQAVVNAALFRSGGHKPVTVDAADYRARRRRTLEGIASRAAEQAALGERVELEPMTPAERKVVHECLKDIAGIETASEGTEPNRFVVVLSA